MCIEINGIVTRQDLRKFPNGDEGTSDNPTNGVTYRFVDFHGRKRIFKTCEWEAGRGLWNRRVFHFVWFLVVLFFGILRQSLAKLFMLAFNSLCSPPGRVLKRTLGQDRVQALLEIGLLCPRIGSVGLGDLGCIFLPSVRVSTSVVMLECKPFTCVWSSDILPFSIRRNTIYGYMRNGSIPTVLTNLGVFSFECISWKRYMPL